MSPELFVSRSAEYSSQNVGLTNQYWCVHSSLGAPHLLICARLRLQTICTEMDDIYVSIFELKLVHIFQSICIYPYNSIV